MKNKIIKIIQIAIILIATIAIKSNATNINLSTNVKEIQSEEEIIVKVTTDKDIETTTFYLEYDNTKLEFIESLTEKAFTKDYPEEGTLRVVYLDPELQGEKEISFKFKVKTNSKDETKITITNLTTQFINDSTVYTDQNLTQSTFETSINIKKKNIITPGIRTALIVVGILIVLLIIVNIISKKQDKKQNKK